MKSIHCLSIKFHEIMSLTASSKLLIILLLSFVSDSRGENLSFEIPVKNIFLTGEYNASDFEYILKSARESYSYIKEVEKQRKPDEKLNFAKNYGEFLLEFFNEIQTKDVDVYEVFSKENSFLKEYNFSRTRENFNITELKIEIVEFQTVAEKYLIAHYNSTEESYEASEILALNQSSFDAFMKEKLRADFSEIGYFFLELFATLIGLSWGVISVAIHYTETNTSS